MGKFVHTMPLGERFNEILLHDSALALKEKQIPYVCIPDILGALSVATEKNVVDLNSAFLKL